MSKCLLLQLLQAQVQENYEKRRHQQAASRCLSEMKTFDLIVLSGCTEKLRRERPEAALEAAEKRKTVGLLHEQVVQIA